MASMKSIRISVVPPDGQAFERLFEGDSIVIGRSSRAGLAVLDPLLSREHARLYRGEKDWVIEDLGSHNGTFLNGEKLDSPKAIRPGDVMGLGATTVSIRSADAIRSSISTASDAFGEQSVFKPAHELLSAGPAVPVGVRDEELRRYVQRLRILNEVHQALSSSITLTELLELILDRVFDHLKPEEGAIFLRGNGEDYYCAASRSSGKNREPALYSRNLVREVAEKGLAALVLDAQADDRFSEAASILSAGIRSLVAAPLLDPEGPLGMIVLGSKLAVRQFTEEDMELLVSLASVAALRIRNVALTEQAMEARRLEHEVALARRIQVALLPQTLPDLQGYELSAGNLPSRLVSGDYYQAMTRKEGAECVLFVADVSGKGIAASLLTASLEALCAAPLEAGREPNQVFDRVSSLLYRRTPPEKYATAILVHLEPATGMLHYANAGHPPGLVLRASGESIWLPATGVPLGLLPESTYEPGESSLEPGDTLVLYSDGISEAEDPEGQQYGKERLEQVCRDHAGDHVADMTIAIEKDMEQFVRGTPYADDRTLVLVKRLP